MALKTVAPKVGSMVSSLVALSVVLKAAMSVARWAGWMEAQMVPLAAASMIDQKADETASQ